MKGLLTGGSGNLGRGSATFRRTTRLTLISPSRWRVWARSYAIYSRSHVSAPPPQIPRPLWLERSRPGFISSVESWSRLYGLLVAILSIMADYFL